MITEFGDIGYKFYRQYYTWINITIRQTNKLAYFAALYSSEEGRKTCNDIAMMLTTGGELA